MPIFEDFDREDHFNYMVEGFGLTQYQEDEPEYYQDTTSALWEGWFASDEELDEMYGPGMWDRYELREEFYDLGFDREDIPWHEWREMMGYAA